MQTETYMLKSRITELNLANAAEHRSSIYQSRQTCSTHLIAMLPNVTSAE